MIVLYPTLQQLAWNLESFKTDHINIDICIGIVVWMYVVFLFCDTKGLINFIVLYLGLRIIFTKLLAPISCLVLRLQEYDTQYFLA